MTSRERDYGVDRALRNERRRRRDDHTRRLRSLACNLQETLTRYEFETVKVCCRRSSDLHSKDFKRYRIVKPYRHAIRFLSKISGKIVQFWQDTLSLKYYGTCVFFWKCHALKSNKIDWQISNL